MKSTNKIQQVCVYCASSTKIADKYFEATRVIAEELVSADIKVVYGGGSVGLMGKLADTVLEKGGKIKGIIPGFMKEVEWDHKGVSDMEVVETMHERKFKFLHDTDALITLPGGCGTFEELMEAITLKRLGEISIPIVIVNIDGYYDPLLEMFDRAIEEHFMRELHKNIWTVIENPKDIIKAITSGDEFSTTLQQAKL